jgi:hypothetical protein
MGEPITGVLKRENVRLNGPCRVGPNQASAARAAPARQPQARIVEQHADHAILEIRCPCGAVTLLRCEWAAGPAAGPAPAPAGSPTTGQ